MTYKEHFKKNYLLAYPIMLSQTGHILVSVSDSVMVGRLGTIPLASVSLANSVLSVIMLFGIGVSYGMTPLVAHADGAQDESKSASVLKHGGIINTLLSIILMFIAFLGAESLQYFGQDPDVLEGAVPYLYILAYSLIPLMIFQSFRQFTEGLSFTKQAMYISISGNVLNVLLNYVMIYGKLGFEPLGLLGAGYATLISRIFMAIAMGSYVLFNSRFEAYQKHFVYIQLNTERFRQILRIGVPSGLQYIFEVGAFSAAAIMIGWIGAVALAAHQIALSLAAITYMMSTGIAGAATIRVGNQFGKNDIVTLRKAGYTCFIMVAVFMAIMAIGFILSNRFLPTLYINDNQVVEYAASLLIIAAIFQVSDGVMAVGLGVLRGLADVRYPTFVIFFAFWIIAIPMGYILGIQLEMGAKGIWYGLLCGLTTGAIFAFLRFKNLSGRLLLTSLKSAKA
ncbi:MAG: MATE family efflux transporter [Cyclobacteriaceae bacterium]|nr:MATE family efflux transporter [Cyclobacteriaceae bacterium]